MIPRFPVSVKALIKENDKVLMIEGLWNGQKSKAFPGGLVEEKESLEEALIREVKEETGLDIKVGRILFATKYTHFTGKENVGIYFSAKIIGGTVKLGSEPNAQFTNTVWLKLSELPKWVNQKLLKIWDSF